MRKAGNILLLLLLLTLVLPACNKDAKTAVATGVDAKVTPTMMTRDVKTLISDSGMTRYRITSKLWFVYDEVKNPYWKFPYELYIEKFDTLFNVEAYIRADSATYFKDKQLWRLDGSVEIRNVKKELFLTEQIFWSQRDHKVYSDSFIHIEKDDRIIEGYGFESNERMTIYQINKPSGIFPVEEERAGAASAQ